MARTELNRNVLPSLIDRLTDEAPKQPQDPSMTHEESLRRFRDSVRRDIGDLLNTRRSIVAVDPVFKEVLESVHEYGLPDFTGTAPSTKEGRQRLCDEVRDTIRTFEPRLAHVSVSITDDKGEKTTMPRVRFIVSGTLLVDPTPERVTFDTVLDVPSGTIEIGAGT